MSWETLPNYISSPHWPSDQTSSAAIPSTQPTSQRLRAAFTLTRISKIGIRYPTIPVNTPYPFPMSSFINSSTGSPASQSLFTIGTSSSASLRIPCKWLRPIHVEFCVHCITGAISITSHCLVYPVKLDENVHPILPARTTVYLSPMQNFHWEIPGPEGSESLRFMLQWNAVWVSDMRSFLKNVPSRSLLPGRESKLYGAKKVMYAEIEEVGTGGFGRVMKVLDVHSGMVLAVKQPLEGNALAECMAKNEIKILKKCQHPGIIELITSITDGSAIDIILAFKSFSLDDGLRTRRFYTATALTPIDHYHHFIRLIRHMLSALTYLAREGIAHLDIKPQNILCGPSGTRLPSGAVSYDYVLADFGIAREIGTQYPESNTGTSGYRAPERDSQGMIVVEASMDIWSMFVVFALFWKANDLMLAMMKPTPGFNLAIRKQWKGIRSLMPFCDMYDPISWRRPTAEPLKSVADSLKAEDLWEQQKGCEKSEMGDTSFCHTEYFMDEDDTSEPSDVASTTPECTMQFKSPSVIGDTRTTRGASVRNTVIARPAYLGWGLPPTAGSPS